MRCAKLKVGDPVVMECQDPESPDNVVTTFDCRDGRIALAVDRRLMGYAPTHQDGSPAPRAVWEEWRPSGIAGDVGRSRLEFDCGG